MGRRKDIPAARPPGRRPARQSRRARALLRVLRAVPHEAASASKRVRSSRRAWSSGARKNAQFLAELCAYDAALETLRSSRVAARDLPWFVLLGEAGCGKTTALRDYAQQFPLAGVSG